MSQDYDLDLQSIQQARHLAERSYEPGFDLRIIVGNNGAADDVRRLVEAGFNPTAFRVVSGVLNKTDAWYALAPPLPIVLLLSVRAWHAGLLVGASGDELKICVSVDFADFASAPGSTIAIASPA